MTPPLVADLIERLVQLAEAATPGPWVVQDGCSWRRIGTRHGDGDVLCPTNHHRDNHPDLTAGRGQDTYANLNFIAAANPEAIKLLCATLTAQAEEIRALREAIVKADGLYAAIGDYEKPKEGLLSERLIEAGSQWVIARAALTQGAER